MKEFHARVSQDLFFQFFCSMKISSTVAILIQFGLLQLSLQSNVHVSAEPMTTGWQQPVAWTPIESREEICPRSHRNCMLVPQARSHLRSSMTSASRVSGSNPHPRQNLERQRRRTMPQGPAPHRLPLIYKETISPKNTAQHPTSHPPRIQHSIPD